MGIRMEDGSVVSWAEYTKREKDQKKLPDPPLVLVEPPITPEDLAALQIEIEAAQARIDLLKMNEAARTNLGDNEMVSDLNPQNDEEKAVIEAVLNAHRAKKGMIQQDLEEQARLDEIAGKAMLKRADQLTVEDREALSKVTQRVLRENGFI
jgi:hypothetical protein